MDVFRLAGTPLDFERRNSRLDELVDERQGAEILRGENRVRRDLELGVRIVDRVSVLIRIAVHRLDEEAAATGLMAFPAVRAAAIGLVGKKTAS